MVDTIFIQYINVMIIDTYNLEIFHHSGQGQESSRWDRRGKTNRFPLKFQHWALEHIFLDPSEQHMLIFQALTIMGWGFLEAVIKQ
jgi:hypothetical protein